MDSVESAPFGFFLFSFPALFSIINPLGGTFLFLAATRPLSRPDSGGACPLGGDP
jgi:small neutral amino acid transporter SnatA (MarC family)